MVATSPAQGDDLAGSCGGMAAIEHAWSFTAPIDATYRISTYTNQLDSVLYVLSGGCDPELACADNLLDDNLDDLPAIYRTEFVDLFLAEGEEVVIVVDGGSGAAAHQVIVGIPVPSDQCCTPDLPCTDAAIVACAENLDPLCNDTTWDELCVLLAQAACNVAC